MGLKGAMILEVENIFRAIKDQRQAILSLEGRGLNTEQAQKASEVEEVLNQLEFKVNDLNFEMEKRSATKAPKHEEKI